MAQLTVVVILQNVALRLGIGPLEQFISAADGHDDARGIVVGRRDVNDVCAALFQRTDAEALLI